MRKLLFLFLISGFFTCSNPRTSLSPERVKEVRGVWITNIDSDVLFSADSIAFAMKTLADQGFNVVFPVVWNKAHTLHPSKVMEQTFGKNFNQDETVKKAGIDPLEIMVFEAHKNGLEIIPWFEFGFSSSYNDNGGHIVKAKPHWAAKDSSGALLKKNGFEWLNGIHPEVQQFMTDLIMEVVENYDIDGIQGDDRLPAMPAHGGYDAFTQSLYQQETGKSVPSVSSDSAFMVWKAGKLNAFAKQLYTKVKDVNPDLIVSFSPSVYPWSFENYLQDSPTWYANGTVDLLIPQVYRYEIDRYKTTLDEFLTHHPGIVAPNSVVTLASGILIKAGPKYNDYETYVKEAVAYNREKEVPGEVYFFYEGLDEKNGNLGEKLALNEYKSKADLPYRKKEFRPKPYYASFLSQENKSSHAVSFDIKKPGVYDFYSKVEGTAAVEWDQNLEENQKIIIRKSKSDYTRPKINGWFWMGQYEIKQATKIGFKLSALHESDLKSSSEVLVLYNVLDTENRSKSSNE